MLLDHQAGLKTGVRYKHQICVANAGVETCITVTFCKNPLLPLTEWKGNDGQFYCSEFCADAGELPHASAVSKAAEMAFTAGLPTISDDTSKKGMQDRTRINTSEDYEIRYWSEKFGVSPDQLKAAVDKVGNTAVEKELKAA